MVQRAMRSWPVVVVEGPRAAGKTTLVRRVVGDAKVFDLSSEDIYGQAASSPRAWVEALPMGTAIDEAQRIANLSLEIKRQADARPGVKGQYLLTGSVRLRRDELGGSDPLVGRARRCTLLPFAQCELGDGPLDVIAALFDDKPSHWTLPPTRQADMFEIMSRGGFPLVHEQTDPTDRRNSLADYVRDLLRVRRRKLGVIPRRSADCSGGSALRAGKCNGSRNSESQMNSPRTRCRRTLLNCSGPF